MGIFCEFANYGYTWDAADRIETVDFLAAFDDEDVTYTHDNAGQVIGADRDGTGAVLDEVYAYDDNGNRTGAQTINGTSQTYASAGTNNQLLNDGKYAYTYDAEGNRLTRTVLVSGVATGEQYVYTWDYRNRLTEVRIKDAAADTTYDRGYKFIYDDQNRLAVKLGDLDGDGDYEEHGDIATFLWDGQNMTVLTPGGQMMSQIYGPQTDQLLFVRETNETFLPLADHLNTVRDVIAAKFDAGTYEAVHVEHNRYDSFGRVIEREQLVGGSLSVTTDPSYIRAGYTGKYFDTTIGLQYNLNRWYDAEVGRWISEDPIGFAGGDANLGRYVGNASVIYVDPMGLKELSIIIHNVWETTEHNDRAIQALQSKRDVIFITGEDIDTIQDVMNEIKSVYNASCDCIKELEFKGHGNQYGMRINAKVKGNKIQLTDDSSTPKATWIGDTNYAYIANVIKSNFKLCNNPTVVLNGCNTGLTAKDKDKSWVQKFSDVLGATVIANAGYCLSYDYYIDDYSSKAVDKYPEHYIGSEPFPKPKQETSSQFGSKSHEPYVFTPTTAADIAKKAIKGGTLRARETALPLRSTGFISA